MNEPSAQSFPEHFGDPRTVEEPMLQSPRKDPSTGRASVGNPMYQDDV